MNFNYWYIMAPLYAVWACLEAFLAYRLFVSKRPLAKFIHSATAVVGAVVLAVMLHVESHHGLVQVLRAQAGDPNGYDDLAHVMIAEIVFLAVSAGYGYAILVLTQWIAKKRAQSKIAARAAKTTSRPAQKPVRIVKDIAAAAPRRKLTKPILVLSDATVEYLDMQAVMLMPGETRIVNLPCKNAGRFEMPAYEVEDFLEALPPEIRAKAEVTDAPKTAKHVS